MQAKRLAGTPSETQGGIPGRNDADLASAARRLLMPAGPDGRDVSIPVMEKAFRELAGIARGCGEARVGRISRAFASILGKAGKAPEGDLPFILDMASAYLESLPSQLRPAAMGTRV